jgi:hypothetical protein
MRRIAQKSLYGKHKVNEVAKGLSSGGFDIKAELARLRKEKGGFGWSARF